MRLGAILAILGTTLVVLAAGPARAACPLDRWEAILNPGPQTPQQIDPGTPGLIAFRFDTLAGPYGKLFAVFSYDGKCFTKALLAGSYDTTTAISRETGEIGPDQRMYHVDLYEKGIHRTLSMSKDPYTLEEIQALAREHLK